jgi:hypothetical protein
MVSSAILLRLLILLSLTMPMMGIRSAVFGSISSLLLDFSSSASTRRQA